MPFLKLHGSPLPTEPSLTRHTPSSTNPLYILAASILFLAQTELQFVINVTNIIQCIYLCLALLLTTKSVPPANQLYEPQLPHLSNESHNPHHASHSAVVSTHKTVHEDSSLCRLSPMMSGVLFTILNFIFTAL